MLTKSLNLIVNYNPPKRCESGIIGLPIAAQVDD
jgi:hypothetical protein